jgi:hypothetical protein
MHFASQPKEKAKLGTLSPRDSILCGPYERHVPVVPSGHPPPAMRNGSRDAADISRPPSISADATTHALEEVTGSISAYAGGGEGHQIGGRARGGGDPAASRSSSSSTVSSALSSSSRGGRVPQGPPPPKQQGAARRPALGVEEFDARREEWVSRGHPSPVARGATARARRAPAHPRSSSRGGRGRAGSSAGLGPHAAATARAPPPPARSVVVLPTCSLTSAPPPPPPVVRLLRLCIEGDRGAARWRARRLRDGVTERG